MDNENYRSKLYLPALWIGIEVLQVVIHKVLGRNLGVIGAVELTRTE